MKQEVTKVKRKTVFVTNICTHYVVRLFELLGEKYDIRYLFTGGYESYWEGKNKLWMGDFNGRYLKGFFLLPKVKITPGLFSLLFKRFDIFIKTIDDRFALPFVFLAAKLQRAPFILWTGIWQHPNTFVHKISFAFMKFIYKQSDAIITYGEHVKKYLVHLGVNADKIFCAPHSVDNSVFNKFVSAEEKNKVKKDLGISQGKIILYVGRLDLCKGLDYFVEAVSRANITDINILFIGTGKQKEVLEGKCKRLSIRHYFLGHISNQDLYSYYAIADIFVLPSVSTKDFKEPWGLVINEAMNQGCPVITTDAVGAAMGGLVEDGINGFILPEKNSDKLGIAIKKLIDNEELLQRMREAARTKIKNWTPTQTREGFIQAIDYVLAQDRE